MNCWNRNNFCEKVYLPKWEGCLRFPQLPDYRLENYAKKMEKGLMRHNSMSINSKCNTRFPMLQKDFFYSQIDRCQIITNCNIPYEGKSYYIHHASLSKLP